MKPNHVNGEAVKGSLSVPPSFPSHELNQPKSGSGLGVAFAQATAVAVVLLAALTVGPYFWEKQRATANAATPPQATDAATPQPEAAPTPTPATPNPADTGKKPTPSPADAGKPTTAKGKDINDVLGESGTKTAKPSVNPLDNKGDDLLKDLK